MQVSSSPRMKRLGTLGSIVASAVGLFGVGLYAPPATAGATENAAAALAGTKPFTVAIDKVAAKRGQPATAKVQFRAASGYHVNIDFPTELRLKLPDGVSAQKATLTKADAKLTENDGRFDVVLTASQSGKTTVLGELRFAVCTATTCDPQRAPVSIELNVE